MQMQHSSPHRGTDFVSSATNFGNIILGDPVEKVQKILWLQLVMGELAACRPVGAAVLQPVTKSEL
jgi:hypothetical protein